MSALTVCATAFAKVESLSDGEGGFPFRAKARSAALFTRSPVRGEIRNISSVNAQIHHRASFLFRKLRCIFRNG